MLFCLQQGSREGEKKVHGDKKCYFVKGISGVDHFFFFSQLFFWQAFS